MHRGVAVWTGRAGRRVFLNTRSRLIALDGATGEPVESFGHRGEIDLTENLLWRTKPTDAPAASTSRSPRPGVAPTRGIDPLSASSSAPVAVPVFSDRIQVVTDHSPQPIGRRSVFRFLDPFATPSGSAKHDPDRSGLEMPRRRSPKAILLRQSGCYPVAARTICCPTSSSLSCLLGPSLQ